MNNENEALNNEKEPLNNENKSDNNGITWPFTIQFLSVIGIPVSFDLACVGNWIGMHLCLPLISLGFIGLIMNSKMKHLRVITIVLSIVNILINLLVFCWNLFITSLAIYGWH